MKTVLNIWYSRSLTLLGNDYNLEKFNNSPNNT